MTNFIQAASTVAVPAHSRFLRQPELLARIGVSWMTILRWEKQGRFPKRHRIGPNTVAWLESDIDSWCAQRVADIAPTKKGV